MSDSEDEEGQEEMSDNADEDFDLREDWQGFIKVSENTVRFRYGPQEQSEPEEPESKKRRVEETSEKATAELRAVAKTMEKLRLLGSRLQQAEDLVSFHASVSKAISESLLHRLAVLRVDDFEGSADPVFGSRYELRRKYEVMEHDLFELLSAAFLPGAKCGLRKLTLKGGYMSAESLMKFLRVAKPPLESFRCIDCLVHGRNFEPIVKTLKASTTSPRGLLEFQMTSYVGGKDPFGLLADAFPNLRVLRTKRIFGETPAQAALERLKFLVKRKCELPDPRQKLEANCKVGGGRVELFMTSEYHDGDYRGQGLNWDDLRNTSECMESWRVGRSVTKEQVIDFMAECGISYNSSIEVESPDSWGGQDDQVETIALQLGVEKSANGLVDVKATTLSGREVATMTAIDPAATLVRTVMEELAEKYPCDCFALRLALPDNSIVEVLSKGMQTLASVLT